MCVCVCAWDVFTRLLTICNCKDMTYELCVTNHYDCVFLNALHCHCKLGNNWPTFQSHPQYACVYLYRHKSLWFNILDVLRTFGVLTNITCLGDRVSIFTHTLHNDSKIDIYMWHTSKTSCIGISKWIVWNSITFT